MNKTKSPTKKAYQKHYKSAWMVYHIYRRNCQGKECYCHEIMNNENLF